MVYRAQKKASPQALQAVRDDELSQHSLQRGYRNGLLAVLCAQPLLFYLLTDVALPQPIILMASLTVFLGVVTLVGSVLVYDR
jgi:hypothetical protein